MLGVVPSVLVLAALALSGAGAHEREVVCYVASWAVYRPSAGRFAIEDIDPNLCTTLVYSFAGLDGTTLTIKSLDPEYDINKKAYERMVNLKNMNPSLKVLMAIGGWTEGSKNYSTMASTRATRKTFIDSTITFIQEHRMDGLDLDWEYPANRGGRPEDKENFVLLAKELHEEYQKRGWMLTAALAAGKTTIDTAYDIDDLAKYLDFMHIMAYDYHGKWDAKTGHNAPLYYRTDESEAEKTLNVAETLKTYLDGGAPPHKLVLGLGFYGRTFLLADATNPAFGAPAQSSAFAGPYTREDGFLGYNEICEKQTRETGWKVNWQQAHQAPYMFKENMWVGYDDRISINLKVAYAQTLGLGGVMVWAIDTDDFSGACSPTGVKYPLLRAIHKSLDSNEDKRPTGIYKPGLDTDTYEADDEIDNNDIAGDRSSSKAKDDMPGGAAATVPAVSAILALLLTSLAAR